MADLERTHFSEEELVWFFYGEADNSAEIDLHLTLCARCRSEYEALKRMMADVESWAPADPAPDYGQEVWRKLVRRDASVAKSRRFGWRSWFRMRQLAAAALAAGLVLFAFIAGRVSHQLEEPASPAVAAVARELERSVPDVHFMLVGGGEDVAMLKTAAAGLGNLTFTGFVDNVGDYLAAFEVFILASNRVGIGSILFDAMEQSLPLVASRVGGVPDIVHHGENGLLIDPASPAQLRDAILHLKANPDLRRAFGERGREFAKDFSGDAMCRNRKELPLSSAQIKRATLVLNSRIIPRYVLAVSTRHSVGARLNPVDVFVICIAEWLEYANKTLFPIADSVRVQIEPHEFHARRI